MPLISRRSFPPGGFFFFQPQSQWPPTQEMFAGLTFDQVVIKIAQHRAANPRFGLSTDLDDIANELDYFTCVRLKFDPNYCVGGPPGAPLGKAQAPLPPVRPVGQPFKPAPSARGAVAAEVKKVTRLVSGVGVLLDWIGSGGHAVDPALATKRANVCVGCPMNQKGGWEHFFTGPAADIIRKQLTLKNEMQLQTTLDKQLSVCDACGCELTLKVWVPLEYVLKKLTPEISIKLDPRCWILSQDK